MDSYTMTESVKDEITVPIVYEGRAAKVILDNSELQEIENNYDECAVAGASDYAIEDYFPEIEAAHSGTLASQWIPQDPELWKIENYEAFLRAREELLAEEANRCLGDLLHGENHWLEDRSTLPVPTVEKLGSIDSEEEEQELSALNTWVSARGLPLGEFSFELSDAETREQQAAFDLAWPQGLQEELSQPVAVLLNESPALIALASQAEYRCFTDSASLRKYVEDNILANTLAY
ncbi:hypothetical protein QEH58_19645 [Roseibacillus persicicus]|nr:hypothetical protein [Roseibacillus persicicus]MDQ8192524.1 hypothetical protein [Roseibacillus persicicus]